MDQANRLRNIIKSREESKPTIQKQQIAARVIAVTSGKGGVGKTNFAVNLAIHLAKQNKRIVIIDADFGLANIEVLFGVSPKYNFGDVLSGRMPISEAMSTGPFGIKFLSGGSGLTSLAEITDSQMACIIDNFAYLDSIADIILIDTGAGISKSVTNFVKASNETIIIVTPEPTSLADAYAIIKTVKDSTIPLPEFKIVLNRVENYREGMEIFERLRRVSEQFLDIKIQSLGTIPYDNNLVRAVKKQEPVSLCYPNSESSKSFESISLRLINMDVCSDEHTGITLFVKKLARFFKG